MPGPPSSRKLGGHYLPVGVQGTPRVISSWRLVGCRASITVRDRRRSPLVETVSGGSARSRTAVSMIERHYGTLIEGAGADIARLHAFDADQDQVDERSEGV